MFFWIWGKIYFSNHGKPKCLLGSCLYSSVFSLSLVCCVCKCVCVCASVFAWVCELIPYENVILALAQEGPLCTPSHVLNLAQTLICTLIANRKPNNEVVDFMTAVSWVLVLNTFSLKTYSLLGSLFLLENDLSHFYSDTQFDFSLSKIYTFISLEKYWTTLVLVKSLLLLLYLHCLLSLSLHITSLELNVLPHCRHSPFLWVALFPARYQSALCTILKSLNLNCLKKLPKFNCYSYTNWNTFHAKYL